MLLCCVMTTNVEFGEWLQAELDSRKIKASDLADRSGVDKTIISRALAGERMPKPETLVEIAKGLDVLPIRIFEAAGYLPPAPKETKEHDELLYLFERMTPQERREALEWFRFKTQKQDAQKDTSRSKRPARVR